MAAREVDEQLAMLCHVELAGGAESLAETVSSLSRAEVDRLLCLAVVALLDAQNDSRTEVERLARRLQRRRSQ
jgi:hypothetical protein